MNKIDNDKILQFIFAGDAVFTVRNEKTGNRFTYRVQALKRSRPQAEKDFFFVKSFYGNENETNYKYFGTIYEDRSFKMSDKSKLSAEAKPVIAFKWLLPKLLSNTLPDFVAIYHEGRCGRCGRRLTVPESILSGFGPECIGYINQVA